MYQYLKSADKAQQAHRAPWYKLTHLDCRNFCLNGLVKAQILSQQNADGLVGSTPNNIIGNPALSSTLSYFGDGTTTMVTSTIYSVSSTITYGSEAPGSGQGQGDAGSGATPPDGGDDGPPN